jgi:hypothetical protein
MKTDLQRTRDNYLDEIMGEIKRKTEYISDFCLKSYLEIVWNVAYKKGVYQATEDSKKILHKLLQEM